MKVFINPGAWPIEGTTRDNAIANLKVFRNDVGIPFNAVIAHEKNYCDGRYAFELRYEGRKCEIQMPGLPLEQTRYQDGLNPWYFPRLYVDGSSWLWTYAAEAAREILLGIQDE